MNMPNMLSLARIALIPVLVLVYYIPGGWGNKLASCLFLVAAFTDWLDGYLARMLKQSTPLGAFLDPVADKLIVAAAIVLLLGHSQMSYLTLPSVVIIGREIAISALREWMAELGKRASVAVSIVGKIKTGLQMASLVILLYLHPGIDDWIKYLGYFLYYLSAALTLWSMVVYFKAAGPDLKTPDSQNSA